MMVGQWRDGFPWVTLTLPGLSGPLNVEFIVDTGFDGDLALPEAMIRQLDAAILESRLISLAGAFRQRSYYYEMAIDWDGEPRPVEVLALEGNPLLGNDLWKDQALRAENAEGGEVIFEPF
jgi:predicted aspartyl protease